MINSLEKWAKCTSLTPRLVNEQIVPIVQKIITEFNLELNDAQKKKVEEFHTRYNQAKAMIERAHTSSSSASFEHAHAHGQSEKMHQTAQTKENRAHSPHVSFDAKGSAVKNTQTQNVTFTQNQYPGKFLMIPASHALQSSQAGTQSSQISSSTISNFHAEFAQSYNASAPQNSTQYAVNKYTASNSPVNNNSSTSQLIRPIAPKISSNFQEGVINPIMYNQVIPTHFYSPSNTFQQNVQIANKMDQNYVGSKLARVPTPKLVRPPYALQAKSNSIPAHTAQVTFNNTPLGANQSVPSESNNVNPILLQESSSKTGVHDVMDLTEEKNVAITINLNQETNSQDKSDSKLPSQPCGSFNSNVDQGISSELTVDGNPNTKSPNPPKCVDTEGFKNDTESSLEQKMDGIVLQSEKPQDQVEIEDENQEKHPMTMQKADAAKNKETVEQKNARSLFVLYNAPRQERGNSVKTAELIAACINALQNTRADTEYIKWVHCENSISFIQNEVFSMSLGAVHSEAHIENPLAYRAMSEVDDHASLMIEASRYSAAIVCQAVDHMMGNPTNPINTSLCITSPPGRHVGFNGPITIVGSPQPIGVFNNIMVGAYYANRKYHQKVAVIDFGMDVPVGSQNIAIHTNNQDVKLFHVSLNRTGRESCSEDEIKRRFEPVGTEIEAFSPEIVLLSVSFCCQTDKERPWMSGADFEFLTQLIVMSVKKSSQKMISVIENELPSSGDSAEARKSFENELCGHINGLLI